jgi:hypothetical protein
MARAWTASSESAAPAFGADAIFPPHTSGGAPNISIKIFRRGDTPKLMHEKTDAKEETTEIRGLFFI